MKKIIFAACALFAMASCTQNEMEGGALHEKQEMHFSSAQIATRVAGDAWEAEDEIGIYVMSNAQVINGNINYYTPAAATIASFLPNLDKGGVQIYYPEAEVFDVFAYHPHNLDIEKGSYTINFASQDGSNPSPRQDYEVLEASKKDLTRNGEPVVLEFTRVFSNIAVNLIAGIGFEESEIDELWRLTLEDQITKTTVSYNAGDEMLTLANDTEKEDIKMTYYEDNPLFRDLVVASDVSFKPAFKLEFFESGAAEETLRLVSTEEITTTRGGQHIFNITVNRTPLGLVGEIAPWVDSDLDLESSDGTYYLADFAGATIIPAHDEWVIMDTDEEALKASVNGDSYVVESLDFLYLYEIIEKAMEKDPSREITLIFPNLETIPDFAFNQKIPTESSKIYGISAPSVTSIGEYAFRGCSKLAKVDLPQVTSIKSLAFENCSSLTEINFGYDKAAGKHAIITDIASNWTNIFSFPEIDLFIGYVQDSNVSFGDDNKTMTVDGTTFTFNSITRERAVVTTLEGLATIDAATLAAANKWIITDPTAADAGAFAALRDELQVLNDTDSKISLEFPNLGSFPQAALQFVASEINTSLVSVSAPEATEIGTNAFSNCTALKTVSFPEVTTIGNYAFSSCSSLKNVSLPLAQTIGEYAFIYCYSLENILLENATSQGIGAFNSCTSLKSITLLLVVAINDYTFFACSALVDASFPVATSVGVQAFYNCSALVDASFPSAISVEQQSFANCSSLKTLNIGYGETLPAEITSIDSNWFTADVPTRDITLYIGDTSNTPNEAAITVEEGNILEWRGSVNQQQTFAEIIQR